MIPRHSMCGIFTYIDPRSTTPGLFSGVRCQSHESCLNVFKPNGSQIEVIWGRVMTPWDSPDWSSTMLWDSPGGRTPGSISLQPLFRKRANWNERLLDVILFFFMFC